MDKLYDFYVQPSSIKYDGIFNKLKTITNENDISQEIISLTTSSLDTSFPPNIILGIGSADSYFRTRLDNVENQSLTIDFKNNSVKLESLQLLTADCDLFEFYYLFGKRNKEEEKFITTFEYPNNPHSCGSFEIIIDAEFDSREKWNSFKIVGSGKRNSNDFRMVIHRLELYGHFFTGNCDPITCDTRKIINIHLLITTIFNCFNLK